MLKLTLSKSYVKVNVYLINKETLVLVPTWAVDLVVLTCQEDSGWLLCSQSSIQIRNQRGWSQSLISALIRCQAAHCTVLSDWFLMEELHGWAQPSRMYRSLRRGCEWSLLMTDFAKFAASALAPSRSKLTTGKDSMLESVRSLRTFCSYDDQWKVVNW